MSEPVTIHFSLKQFGAWWTKASTRLMKRFQPSGFVCIEIQEEAFSLVSLKPASGQLAPLIKQCDFVPCIPEDLGLKLKELVSLYHLNGMACSWLLNSKYYQLIMIEAPRIPKEEIPEALPWLVKDLIDFPLEEAIVDFIELPETVFQSIPRILIAVSSKTKLEAYVTLILNSGLSLEVIDINALALKNIFKYLPQYRGNVAILCLEQAGASLSIFCDSALCLVRQINFPLFPFPEEGPQLNSMVDNLAEEIGRTFDYCSVEMQNIAPKKILLLPVKDSYKALVRLLFAQLPDLFEEINFASVLQLAPGIMSANLVLCGSAMTGALREVI